MNTAGPQFLHRSAWVLAVAIMVACSWLAPLDSLANQQVDIGLKRALISFATARALNAVISVAQGTEVAIEPGGVGVVLTPGQLLDPINDLVETFSTLMLVASISFGVQKVLIAIGAHQLVSLLLSIVALGWAFFYLRQQASPAWLSRLFIILLMTRFALPIVTLGSDLLFQKFMAADYQTSQQNIDSASAQMGKPDAPVVAAPNEGPGVIQNIKTWWRQNTDENTQFKNLKQSAEQAIEHIVKLIVIFLLQTLLIPLLLLWALYGVAQKMFELPDRKR